MGVRHAQRARRAVTAAAAASVTPTGLGSRVDPSRLPISSPWSSGQLQRIVFEDVFGKDIPQNTRSSAMRIPAVARGRNLVVSTVSGIPLREYDAAGAATPAQPGWLSSTAVCSPIMRLGWTVDDLMFYGWSAWATDRDSNGVLGQAVRLDQDEWEITEDNQALVNGREVTPLEIIIFGGLHEGILSFGREALEDARDLYSIVRQRLRNPTPALNLKQTGGDDMTDPEIDKMIDRWAKARQGANGGVGFTNRWVDVEELGAGDAQLMIEARNAAAVDMARLIGVHAGSIDATAPKASLNYETATGRNQEFVDFDLKIYLLPIAARLSMDDVTPAGRRVEFDLSDFTAATPSVSGPQRDD